MKRNTTGTRSSREIIRAAADSLDYDKLRAETHLSMTERLQLLFELCDQERQNMFLQEQAQHPDEGEELLWRRVRDRILEQQDLSDKVRADLQEWILKRESGDGSELPV